MLFHIWLLLCLWTVWNGASRYLKLIIYSYAGKAYRYSSSWSSGQILWMAHRDSSSSSFDHTSGMAWNDNFQINYVQIVHSVRRTSISSTLNDPSQLHLQLQPEKIMFSHCNIVFLDPIVLIEIKQLISSYTSVNAVPDTVIPKEIQIIGTGLITYFV